MSAGHIRSRGPGAWELKYDVGTDSKTGRRITRYKTVRGRKSDAQRELRNLLGAVDNSTYIEPAKLTVAEHVRGRVDHWQAAGDISALTAEGYHLLVDAHVVPHLGAKPIQKLTTLAIEGWHTELLARVGARTVERAHRVLSQALKDGMRHGLLIKNVAAIQGAPKVAETEVQVVPQERIGELTDQLRGRPLYPVAITALFTGMRRNEILALRWSNVDLDGKLIRVREALEETRALGLQVKAPKTRAGRRDVTLPAIVVDALRDHRRQQLELRMALGIGKMPEDAMVFPEPLTGSYQAPRAFSQRWARVAAAIGMPAITFHALRHTHASMLIDAGIDIVTISKRLGHAKPDITLRIYAHLFRKDDSRASDAINEALGASR